jgi:hypothetical protein
MLTVSSSYQQFINFSICHFIWLPPLSLFQPQINGVDMRSANHDQAVQQLTETQRFVRLVIEREVKGPLEPPQSPRSPLLKGLSPTGYMANRPSKKKSYIFLNLRS